MSGWTLYLKKVQDKCIEKIEPLESIERERQKSDIAEQIYNLRAQAGLSQKQLANLIGTTQSVISRLEDADYNGHSLAMLRKIASALHQRVQIEFVPENTKLAFG